MVKSLRKSRIFQHHYGKSRGEEGFIQFSEPFNKSNIHLNKTMVTKYAASDIIV
ncbi:MAG: hypothetical protein IPL23_13605 [Saprospiraceae bacterium]|nr:hypothetical protein [Saprospiraceae bacterium]